MNDSHAHLTLSPIDRNCESIVRQFVSQGGKHILNVAHDPESLNKVVEQHRELDAAFPNVILCGLGVHPECFSDLLKNEGFDIYERSKRIVDMAKQSLTENLKIASAVGETGLDYFHIFNDSSLEKSQREEIMEAQKNSFKEHAQWALEYDLPLSIHTRDLEGEDAAVVDAMQIITDVGRGKLRGSFHS